MADNVIANAGSGGETFATDEIAGVHYPKTKIVMGGDDVAVQVTTATPLEMRDQDARALLTTIDADAGNILAEVASMDSNLTLMLADTANIDAQTAAIDSNLTLVLADTAAIQTAVELIDDAVRSAGDSPTKHLQIGGEYNSTPPTMSNGTTGALQTDVNGHLITSPHADSIALGDNVSNSANVAVDEAGSFMQTATVPYYYDGSTWDRQRGDATDGLLVNLGANNDVAAAGNVAHDAADSGNPVKIGGVARTTTPAAVADGDRVDGYFDELGRQVVTLGAPRDLEVDERIVLTSTTETTCLTGVASVMHDLVGLFLTNESSTAVRVDIRDGLAGTIRYSAYLAASGGGHVVNFAVPLSQATAANHWTAQLSSAVSSVYVTAQAIKAV